MRRRTQEIPTKIFHLEGKRADGRAITVASAVIRRGGLVAFPTETVYGLGANALSAEAVSGIFRAKGRPGDNPLIVHLHDARELSRVAVAVPPVGRRLARTFWPGPLTLVLRKHPRVPDATTAGLDTVAVRVPDHPVAHRLIRAARVPVAAPSANLSGRPSLTSPEHLVGELKGKVDVILLAGDSTIGVESTVVDLVSSPPILLRAGGLPVERIIPLVPDLRVPSEETDRPHRKPSPPRSPGMKYRHYAPRAPLTLFEGPPEEASRALHRRMTELLDGGRRVGLLVNQEFPLRGRSVWVLGSRNDPVGIAFRLFKALREADASGVDEILVQGIPPTGLGLAVMDRLRRAAGSRIVHLDRQGPPSRRGRRLPKSLTYPNRQYVRPFPTAPTDVREKG